MRSEEDNDTLLKQIVKKSKHYLPFFASFLKAFANFVLVYAFLKTFFKFMFVQNNKQKQGSRDDDFLRVDGSQIVSQRTYSPFDQHLNAQVYVLCFG